MLVLGLIVIVGLGFAPLQLLGKMQLPELMHNMGMHADTLTLAYAANGAYHIQQTFSSPVYVVLYLVWLFALWFHRLTVSGALCNHWDGTTKYGSIVGNVFLTSILRLLYSVSHW